MKITDLKRTVLSEHPIVRITTDEGISGYGQKDTAWCSHIHRSLARAVIDARADHCSGQAEGEGDAQGQAPMRRRSLCCTDYSGLNASSP